MIFGDPHMILCTKAMKDHNTLFNLIDLHLHIDRHLTYLQNYSCDLAGQLIHLESEISSNITTPATGNDIPS